MQGRDLFGRARTGTGKTLAFGIPVLDRILKYNAQHGYVYCMDCVYVMLFYIDVS